MNRWLRFLDAESAGPTLGAAALAAHTVVNQAVYVVFMVAVGISHATSISISPARAGHDVTAASRFGCTELGLAWLAIAGAAVPYLAAPQWFLSGFVRDGADTADLLALATPLLWLAALLEFSDASQNIAVGLLRGVGDTGSAFVGTPVGYCGHRPGLRLTAGCAQGARRHRPLVSGSSPVWRRQPCNCSSASIP